VKTVLEYMELATAHVDYRHVDCLWHPVWFRM